MHAANKNAKGAVADSARRFYEFGLFRLDPIRRRLSYDGKFVPLYPKAVEALIILVEHSGEILEREALVNALWPGMIVEESNLTVAISHLRKVLGQNGDGLADSIQTIPRVGYRFVAAVREVVEEPPPLIGKSDHQHNHVEIDDASENGIGVSGDQPLRRPAIVTPPIEQRPLPSKTTWLLGSAIAAIAIACLLLAIAVNVLVRERSSVPQPGVPKPEKSVAVLPFENLSNDREDAFFADGVQDDLLTKLANISALKVISRTSVIQYRPAAAGRNMREIGKALGVSHVLEGSVRKTGAWLHINAQLIDTRTDSHIWAKQYDGDLKDLFTIQSEIAQKVAEELRVKISAAENAVIERPPTADLTAFALYSRAKNLLLMSASTNRRANLVQAADLLNQAVARDPTFFQAYCQLASIHDHLYFVGFDRTPERLALAEAAIRAATRLRPDAAEAHLARAEHVYRGYLDYDGALAELAVAQQTLPNDPRIFELKGYIERLRPGGNQEEALHNFERAIELDPRNFFILQQTALSYNFLRRYREEEAAWERALAVEPNDAETRVARAFVEFNWKANPQPLHQLIDELRVKDPPAIQSVADSWLICALAERDPRAAANALAAIGENGFGFDRINLSRSFGEGLVARMSQNRGKARSAFMVAHAEQEKIVETQPDYGPAVCVLGLIDAALGRKDEALREGRRAVQLLPVERDAIGGAHMIEYFAVIAAWIGEKDLACEQLAIAIHPPSRLSYGQLKLLPFWDPLRGDPRFEAIVTSLAPK
jgi:TolB-like protein/DNA-binding winged helix-turn-helix (wHTH) protein